MAGFDTAHSNKRAPPVDTPKLFVVVHDPEGYDTEGHELTSTHAGDYLVVKVCFDRQSAADYAEHCSDNHVADVIDYYGDHIASEMPDIVESWHVAGPFATDQGVGKTLREWRSVLAS